MPYCSRCGVEVDKGVASCPLCSAPIQTFDEAPPPEKRFPDFESDDKPRMDPGARRTLAWEVITILAVIAVVVVVGTDLLAHARILWSLYPAGAVLLTWILCTLLLNFRRSPWIVAAGTVLALAAVPAAMNAMEGGLDWYLPLALPILILLVVVAGALALVISKVRFVGLNVVAYASLGAAVVCAGVDLLIGRFATGRILLSWSVIVLQALLPFALIVLFLHYRLRNRFDFKRVFHL